MVGSRVWHITGVIFCSLTVRKYDIFAIVTIMNSNDKITESDSVDTLVTTPESSHELAVPDNQSVVPIKTESRRDDGGNGPHDPVTQVSEMRSPHMVSITKGSDGSVVWSIQCFELSNVRIENDGDFNVMTRPCLIKSLVPVADRPDMSTVSETQGEHFIADGKLYMVNNDQKGGTVLSRPVLNVCGLWAHTLAYAQEHGHETPWLQDLIDRMGGDHQATYVVDLGVGVDSDFVNMQFIGLDPVRVVD